MDYSKFILEDFQPKEWINNLISLTSPESIEKDLTNIVIKLQFYMQEMNAIVDESTQTAFQSLPRIIRDMERVRQEATILQEQMNLIKCDIEKEEKSTQESMYKLLQIDAQKKKLSQVENSLQEADSWSQICDNIDSVMKSGDINKIADKISCLQHSLSMLSATPDFDEREKKVQNLCDNFESLLGPQLIQAFFNGDLDFIRIGLRLLETINRVEYGSKYYIAWFKPSVLELWNHTKSITANEKIEDALKQFFENLLVFINNEINKKIFPHNGAVLVVALTESMNQLVDQFNQIIVKSHPNKSEVHERINFMIKCVQITDSFCEQLESSLKAKCPDLDESHTDICNRLSTALYSPYATIDEIFVRDSEVYIQQKLNNINMSSVDVADSIDNLDASIEAIIELGRESIRICQSMTHFVSVDSLIDCIKNLFTNYIQEFKRVSLNIILKLSNQQTVSSDHNEGVDNGMDDYYFLQDGIRLTSIGGKISMAFESFLKEMLSQITTHIQKLNSSQLQTKIFFRQYSTVMIQSQSRQIEMKNLWNQICHTNSQIDLLKLPRFKQIEDCRQYVRFKLLRWLNKKVFENAIEPVKKSLANIHKFEIWQEELETGEDLPMFAFSPQEYITKIGQFFMTLPQQLEPFFSNNNKFYQEALINGQLPHLSNVIVNNWLETDNGALAPDNDNLIQVGHVWLECIVSGCVTLLLEKWLSITKLSTNGKHQLQADIIYIKGVVEDLEMPLLSDLNLFSSLIMAPNGDELAEIIASVDVPIKMMEMAKKMF